MAVTAREIEAGAWIKPRRPGREATWPGKVLPQFGPSHEYLQYLEVFFRERGASSTLGFEAFRGVVQSQMAETFKKLTLLENQVSDLRLTRDSIERHGFAIQEGGRSVHLSEVSDEIAENMIRGFLAQQARTGATSIDLLTLVAELKLPPPQIERLMDKVLG